MKQKNSDSVAISFFRVTPSVGQLRSTMPTMWGVNSGVLTNSVHELLSNSGKLSIMPGVYYQSWTILLPLVWYLHLILCALLNLGFVVTFVTEISLVDYSIVRLDRNRHGGGIILYIKNNLNFDIITWSPWFRTYFCLFFTQ